MFMSNKRFLREVVWLAIMLIISLVVAIGGLSATSGNEEMTGVNSMVHGTADRPYVYRQLVPLCIRGILAVVPGGFQTQLEHKMVSSGFIGEVEYLSHFNYSWWQENHLLEIGLSFLINVGSLLLFSYAYRSMLCQLVVAPDWFFFVLPAVVIYGLVYLNRSGVYIYDYPQILLFTAGLLCLAKGKIGLYYPIYCLGCLNKETTILLLMAFVLNYKDRMSAKMLLIHSILQFAIFATIKLSLNAVFAHNPGQVVASHNFINHNVRIILNPCDEFSSVVIIVGLFALAMHDWNKKPVFLRQASLLLFPLLIVTILFGWMDEYRDYYEVYPIIMALAGLSFAKLVFNMNYRAKPIRSGENISAFTLRKLP